MSLLPFLGLLTCLRPLFLPSGCWMRRLCWPGSLWTLATLSSSNSVSGPLERVRTTVLWWVLAKTTSMKQSLQRYHYLWRKVGKVSLGWEISVVWEGGRGLVASSCQNWDFFLSHWCHICHSAKHWFDHTPGLEATKRLKMSHSNLNFFFSKGKGKGGDKQTQTSLSHGWEHLC